MDDPPPTAWQSGARPVSRRKLAIGCLGVLVVLFVGIAVLWQSRIGRGFEAAIAIYDHGKPDIVRAYFREVSGRVSTMDVYLAVGTDPGRASAIGCGVVRDELQRASLTDVRWVIYAGNGEAVASSDEGCP